VGQKNVPSRLAPICTAAPAATASATQRSTRVAAASSTSGPTSLRWSALLPTTSCSVPATTSSSSSAARFAAT
jgi:hypothetical protein